MLAVAGRAVCEEGGVGGRERRGRERFEMVGPSSLSFPALRVPAPRARTHSPERPESETQRAFFSKEGVVVLINTS